MEKKITEPLTLREVYRRHREVWNRLFVIIGVIFVIVGYYLYESFFGDPSDPLISQRIQVQIITWAIIGAIIGPFLAKKNR